MSKQAKHPKASSNHSWNPLPPPAHGDASAEETFAAVGRALTAWEQYENYLASLFASFVGAGKVSSAGKRAYGAITTFNGRAEMIKAAAEVYFSVVHRNAADEKTFLAHLGLARNFAKRRNEIAHGIVEPYGVIASQLKGYCLFPAYYNSGKRPFKLGGPKYAYASPQITYYETAFQNLAAEGDRLWRKLFPRNPSSGIPRKPMPVRELKRPPHNPQAMPPQLRALMG